MSAAQQLEPLANLSIQVGSIERKETKAVPSASKNGDTSTFQEVKFATPFAAGSKVVVVPMVQTFNGSVTPGVRIADVTRSGFKIRMNELVTKEDDGSKEVLSAGGHATETIGWIALATS